MCGSDGIRLLMKSRRDPSLCRGGRWSSFDIPVPGRGISRLDTQGDHFSVRRNLRRPLNRLPEGGRICNIVIGWKNSDNGVSVARLLHRVNGEGDRGRRLAAVRLENLNLFVADIACGADFRISGSWDAVVMIPIFGALANRRRVISKRLMPKRSQYCFGIDTRQLRPEARSAATTKDKRNEIRSHRPNLTHFLQNDTTKETPHKQLWT